MYIFFLIKVSVNKEKVARKKNFTVSDVLFKCNSNLTFSCEREEEAACVQETGEGRSLIERAAIKNA